MNFDLTEEQQMVRDTARRFAETEIKPVAAKLDATHEHPAEICQEIGRTGLSGHCRSRGIRRRRHGLRQLRAGPDRDLQGLRLHRRHHVGEQFPVLLPGHGLRNPRTENEIPEAGGQRRDPGLLRPDRGRGRLGPGRHAHHGRAGRRRLGHQRREEVHHQRQCLPLLR